MKQTSFAAIFVLVLLVSVAIGLEVVCFVSANPDGSNLQLSMPIEHINYTITDLNGALWAKIDGSYPITILNQGNCTVLPMLYPMPPNSTNIHVILNDVEIEWSNYTASSPESVHRTAIGDWWMISCVLGELSDSFLLEIHYEHPLEIKNGSYLFPYDLNINDYLSPESPTSTAHFHNAFGNRAQTYRLYCLSRQQQINGNQKTSRYVLMARYVTTIEMDQVPLKLHRSNNAVLNADNPIAEIKQMKETREIDFTLSNRRGFYF